MIITGEFYRLTPINDHSSKFDLELLHEIGGKNPRKEFKIVGYGLSLENAIARAIAFGINKRFGEEVVTLKQFLNVYKEESDKIRQELGDVVS